MSAWQAAPQDEQLAILWKQAKRYTVVLEQLVGATPAPARPALLSVTLNWMAEGEDPLVFRPRC